MDPNWAFCPACGTDNREPRLRTKIKHHHCVYVSPRLFCVKCGRGVDEPYRIYGRARVNAATAFCGLGTLSLLGAALIQLGLRLESTPLGAWVGSWYYNQVTRTRRYRTYTVDLGSEWTRWLFILGLIALVIGLSMFYKVPFREDDDDGLGRRRRTWP